MAVWKLDKIGGRELGEVKMILNSFYMIVDQENDFDSACCGQIQISSQGIVEEIYPFILGNYRQIETKYNRNTFVKKGLPKMFLIQPATTPYVWGHTWGVSRSADGKWGYIRSSGFSPCPDMAGKWKVFDKNTKSWVIDRTLLMECSGKLL